MINTIEAANPTLQDLSKVPFGSKFTQNMLRATFDSGAWGKFSIVPLENFNLHPAAMVLHYSQSIFEGLKAYRQANGSVALFRPSANAARLARSAQRMAIPPIDEAAFVHALVDFVAGEASHVPPRPGSLYLRPTIFASEAMISVRPSNQYEFFVIAAPVGSYFSPGATQDGIEIFVSDSVPRAVPGGTGAVKAGANYGVSLKTIGDAKAVGSTQVLFLDSGGKRLIEEAGGMNVFIVRGQQLITPPLTGTILAGVTRDSILVLAASLGLDVVEQAISMDTLVAEIKAGTIREVFLSGTAAVIVSVDRLRFEDGGTLEVSKAGDTPIATLLLNRLTDIQFGAGDDPFHWRLPVG